MNDGPLFGLFLHQQQSLQRRRVDNLRSSSLLQHLRLRRRPFLRVSSGTRLGALRLDRVLHLAQLVDLLHDCALRLAQLPCLLDLCLWRSLLVSGPEGSAAS